MCDLLFELRFVDSDPFWVVKEFFNSSYSQGVFFEAVESILRKCSFVVNEDCCLFPDFESDDHCFHFEGVKFCIMDDQLVISEEECAGFVLAACNIYMERHPMDKNKLQNILVDSNLGGGGRADRALLLETTGNIDGDNVLRVGAMGFTMFGVTNAKLWGADAGRLHLNVIS